MNEINYQNNKSNSSTEPLIKRDMKKDDQTAPELKTINNYEMMIEESKMQIEPHEESKSSDTVKVNDSNQESLLLKNQVTLAHIEIDANSENIKSSQKEGKIPKCLSLPYSPALLQREKKCSTVKKSQIINSRLVEPTKLNLNENKDQDQSAKKCLPLRETEKQNLNEAHRINEVSLRLKQNLFGD